MQEENKNSTAGAGGVKTSTTAPTGNGVTPGTAGTPGGAVAPKVEKNEETKPKKIEVDENVLKSVLDRVDKLEEDNKILREVADKNRLGRVEELRAQGKLVKSVNLNTFDGKIIMGWKKIKDDVYTDQEGRLHEEQIIGLIFLDEETNKPQVVLNKETDKVEMVVGKEMDIRSFSRLITKVMVEVLEEGKDKEGNVNFVVQTKDGREIKIDSKFVN